MRDKCGVGVKAKSYEIAGFTRSQEIKNIWSIRLGIIISFQHHACSHMFVSKDTNSDQVRPQTVRKASLVLVSNGLPNSR